MPILQPTTEEKLVRAIARIQQLESNIERLSAEIELIKARQGQHDCPIEAAVDECEKIRGELPSHFDSVKK